DEPTAGLDPIASTRIENVIRDLGQMTGTCQAYAIVTHQDSTIRRTADKIVFLYEGKVHWQGPMNEAYTADNLHLQQFFSGSVEGPIQ
ncbi:MAG: ABC transporter ATP-binding protein, partial [Cyanothece sp. SIO1E1]|nr:ABC transporter ATP-binding protein [Cyanothece sp. SIO1E1]